MLVEVVQLRATGMKLEPAEVAEAARYRGNLTISREGIAYLHLGESPYHGHVVAPLTQARMVTMRGDDFVLTGMQSRAYGKTTDSNRQTWWCKNLRGDHLPDAPLFTGR